MARDPGSLWRPLPEAGAPDGYVKTQLIFHSTGDNASADRIRNYFANLGVVVESTFVVGKDASDPTLQVMDSTDNADANVESNQRAIAVEVVNDGNSPWTNWQVAEAIRIGRWALAEPAHKIAPRICRSATDPGFGWHVMFGAPGPWTTVRGKVCPGAPAIAQLKSVIFPAIFADYAPVPFEEDDDMKLIRNPKGAVYWIVGDKIIGVPNGTQYKALQDAGIQTAQLSADFFAEVVKALKGDEPGK